MCGCCGDDKSEEEPKPKPLSRNNVCCTDILFLILFVAFLGLMVYIGVLSVLQGDGRRLLYGYDSFGNTCNEDNTLKPIPNLTLSGRDTTGHSNVFFLSVFLPFEALQLCVAQCPDRDLMTKEDVQDFAQETGVRLCRYDIDVDRYLDSDVEYGLKGPCPSLPVYKSVSLIQRCAPDPSALIGFDPSDVDAVKTVAELSRKNATDSFFQVFELDNLFRKVLSDLYNSWREMLILCVAAVVFAFIMVLMVRFLAGFIVWAIVVLSAVGSLVGTGFLWWTYARIKTNMDHQVTYHIPLLDVDIKNETAFLAFSIIATVLTVILLLILLVMRKRIGLTVALFHEAGKCLIDMPLLLVQPIWTFLILAAFLISWFIILAFIGSSGNPTANYDKGFGTPSVEYTLAGFARHFWWIHLIGLIWISEFILACQQFVIGGSVAIWFFTRDKKELNCPIYKSMCRLVLHHIGSVALGAFIILLVKVPRYILMYIQSKCEGTENACAKCCLKCCICCLWCLEKLLKFLNQNAYTIIAIDGNSFCPSAKKAFSIIANNVLRVATINSVGAFVLFLGKIGVMAATCAIAVIWLRTNPVLHFYAIPVFFVCVFAFLCAHCALAIYESEAFLSLFALPYFVVAMLSYLIAHQVLSLFEMVVDALLLCFCEDCALNDGTPGHEYYMHPSLMKYVKNSEEAIRNLERKGKAPRNGKAGNDDEGTEMIEK